MLCTVFSATTYGLEGVIIKVEVDVADRGFPTFVIVGLPDKAVEESKERVRTAIKNSSFQMPETRIIVNLAPADIPKEGCLFDLPIALGILVSANVISKDILKNSLFVGELSLEGKIRSVPGILSIVLMAKENGIQHIFIPQENVLEASLVKGITIFGVKDLVSLILHVNKEILLEPASPISLENITNEKYEMDFADINGQVQAKRALEIAASGFHNISLKGPPGGGKTLLARSFPSILPHMDEDEIIDVSRIYSIVQGSKISEIKYQRPFRSPHHTTSRVGLIGGGTKLKPGEISLAHRGVLFLDEFAEFPRSVLEALRQPMEDGVVSLSRAVGSVSFPARFLLLAASNPCPCGYLGHPKRQCTCSIGQVMRYKKRISGPILDRIDLHIDVPQVEHDKLTSYIKSEGSSDVRMRVEKARKKQLERLKGTSIKTNGEMSSQQVKEFCKMEESAHNLLKIAVTKLSISARSYFKLIKISQTIADLAGEEVIKDFCISEALQYRVQDE